MNSNAAKSRQGFKLGKKKVINNIPRMPLGMRTNKMNKCN